MDDIGFSWSVLDAQWDAKLNELIAYKNIHGDVNVSKYSSPELGRWATMQRMLYKQGDLSDERIGRLNMVGFEWNPTERSWELKFEELKRYKLMHGDANPPHDYENGLGLWTIKQRQDKRKNKLDGEKVKLLDEICFNWDPIEKLWEEKFGELIKYKSAHGDTNVPQDFENGLGGWVSTQRRSKKMGILSQERENKLNDIGFLWIGNKIRRS